MDLIREVISTALQTSESAMAQLQLLVGKFAYFVGKKQAVTALSCPLMPTLCQGCHGKWHSDSAMAEHKPVHEATKSPPWTHPSIQNTRRKTKWQQRQEEKSSSTLRLFY